MEACRPACADGALDLEPCVAQRHPGISAIHASLAQIALSALTQVKLRSVKENSVAARKPAANGLERASL
ncbi:MAG TPA: hypothetical protein VJ396_02970 [Acidiferrobacterales bacterium]|nr:hypothetical protein [Acidiferrobacterales bacterium]